MGSILSKLFGGGGGGGSHGSSAQQQQQPPPALLPPPTTAAASSSLQHSTGTPLPRSTSSASSKHQPASPSPAVLAPGQQQQQTVLTPAPINILEVEVDEEAFREAASPPIYTSTLKAQIDPSPPHPLELSQHVAIGQKTSISSAHLVTHLVDVPNGSCAQQNVVVTPIASLDSEDYEDYDQQLQLLGQEREEAVIKIQAGVRGYLVRKQMVHGKLAPAKSISLDESVLSSVQQQQQQQPEHILPPPERFDSSGSSKPVSIIQSKHRVETPIPGSPFAQDDTDYSILDALDPTEQEEQVQSAEVQPLIANTEELEIFRKINEINQLLASKDDDKLISIVPETPASNSSLQQETTATLSMNNSAVSSSSIANALSELDQTIHEQESLMSNTLHPEESVESTKQEEEVLILESAFSDVPLNSAADNQPEHPSTQGPMSPSVLIKAPSLDEEDLPYENFPSGGDPLEASSFPLSETAAAIRIQAAFRGYEVRKSLSREVSPARSTEEEEKVVAAEENTPEAAEVDQAKEKTAAEQAAAPAEPAVPEAAAAAAEAAKPTAEDFAQVLSLIPQPVDEELFPVMELSDQDIIEDYEEEKEEKEKAPTAATSEEQPATLADAQVNVAVKEGFGTLASSGKAAAEASTAEKAEKAAAAAPSVMPDIEKSIQELEKSFDRDLLADVSSEATAAAAVAPSSTPATPTVIEAEKADSDQQSQPQTLSEEKSPISIEPPTPEITSSQPLFSTEQQPSPQLPSKIPILDRANKSILKEPSSPEPHTYTNLSPLLSSPAAADGGNEDSDEESCSTPSPIPLRSSSPSPFSKKRPRRHRKKK